VGMDVFVDVRVFMTVVMMMMMMMVVVVVSMAVTVAVMTREDVRLEDEGYGIS
jgi:hypothetical protein